MFGRKQQQEKVRDIPKYPEGTIIRRIGDPENKALIIYKNLHDYQKDNGSILAAEFVHDVAANTVTFTENFAVTENDVEETKPVFYFNWFLNESRKHYKETGGFLRSVEAYYELQEAKRRAEEAASRYVVSVELVTGTVLTWPNMRQDDAIAVFNGLRTAQTEGLIWRSTFSDMARESISGKYIVHVCMQQERVKAV